MSSIFITKEEITETRNKRQSKQSPEQSHDLDDTSKKRRRKTKVECDESDKKENFICGLNNDAVQLTEQSKSNLEESQMLKEKQNKNGQISCSSVITETGEQQQSTFIPIKQNVDQEANDNKKNTFQYNINTNKYDIGSLKCVAILPGLGNYTESSDSEMSSDSDDEPFTNADNMKYDLVGRPISKTKQYREE